MRLNNSVSRSFAKWTFAIGLSVLGVGAMAPQAAAHHPFHHHHHHHFGGYGYGWGSHYYAGYSSFYGSNYGYPSISFGYVPRFYSVSYYTPTYFAPVYYSYYSPVYYTPAYYAPTYYVPACNTWSNININTGFPLARNTTSPLATNSVASNLRPNSPLALPSRTSLPSTIQARGPLAGVQVAKVDTSDKASDRSVQLASYKPAVVQPYSPIWTKAAVGIVDEMIAAGEFDHAHTSCKSMERITQPKGSGVYLRQALLGYFATDANATTSSTETALNLLEQACQSGCQVQATELNKDSLRSYFAACLVDVSGSMDKLSQRVLETNGNSTKELLLLSALLKLDGQSDRAKLFASEVQSQVANSREFHWHNLLNACLSETL